LIVSSCTPPVQINMDFTDKPINGGARVLFGKLSDMGVTCGSDGAGVAEQMLDVT